MFCISLTTLDGDAVGRAEGESEGLGVGLDEGESVGALLGFSEGDPVGLDVVGCIILAEKYIILVTILGYVLWNSLQKYEALERELEYTDNIIEKVYT